MLASFTQRLTVTLLKLLPARSMGRIVYWLSRSERPWLKDLLINGFSKLYKVATLEAEKSVPEEYRSFNEFFTRKLKPAARPVDPNPNSLVCPADGTIAQIGMAHEQELLQAKGKTFTAADLLGDADMAVALSNCAFTTIYLAPYNYHRLHMPLDGTLEQTIFIPGLLYSVNAATTATIDNLYALNERLVCFFSSPHGPFAMTLVGAMNVASISTAWGGEIKPSGSSDVISTYYAGRDDAPTLSRGEYMGHFNMGSTIVLMTPPGKCSWDAEAQNGNVVRMGQRLGSVRA
jgi:phosphatidylserine decarboxylase